MLVVSYSFAFDEEVLSVSSLCAASFLICFSCTVLSGCVSTYKRKQRMSEVNVTKWMLYLSVVFNRLLFIFQFSVCFGDRHRDMGARDGVCALCL